MAPLVMSNFVRALGGSWTSAPSSAIPGRRPIEIQACETYHGGNRRRCPSIKTAWEFGRSTYSAREDGGNRLALPDIDRPSRSTTRCSRGRPVSRNPDARLPGTTQRDVSASPAAPRPASACGRPSSRSALSSSPVSRQPGLRASSARAPRRARRLDPVPRFDYHSTRTT